MSWIEKLGKKWYLRDRVNGKKVIIEGGLETKELAEEIKGVYDNRNEKPPNGKFDVILADPPWRYDFSKSKSRAVESHYPTMELEDICKLDVPSTKNAVLYLWATAPKIREALRVMESWGFEYKTQFVWVKPRIGMGYWARNKHELLFVGTKGKMSPPESDERYQTVIHGSVGEHSKKPDVVYDIIESAFPPTEYRLLELFARGNREVWSSWGVVL